MNYNLNTFFCTWISYIRIQITVTKHSTNDVYDDFSFYDELVCFVCCCCFRRLLPYGTFTFENVINKRVICFKSTSRLLCFTVHYSFFFTDPIIYMNIQGYCCLFVHSRNMTKRSTAKLYSHFHSEFDFLFAVWKIFAAINMNSDGKKLQYNYKLGCWPLICRL